jgi:CubicO group peptidase (beta-lactamase class C family)
MAAVSVQSLDDVLKHEIDAGSFPSAACAIGSTRGLGREFAAGNAVAVPLRIGATTDTIYDVASLTKVLVTTILVLQAVAEKRIALDDDYEGFTYRQLLTHTSGLKSWLPLYAFDESYVRTIRKHGIETAPDTPPQYSDLNFVLLWAALREIFDADYVTLARTRILEPLELRDAMFNPPAVLKPRIAATEWGQRFEAKMAADRAIPFAGFRQGLMWGEVNDGNSFHAGGTCGNAGLFATARDVFRIVQAFANGELVPRELVALSTHAHAGDRGLGWQVGPLGYGHTGFTGTSVWVKDDRISVLLTNRVHPCAASIAMQRIRTTFHSGVR